MKSKNRVKNGKKFLPSIFTKLLSFFTEPHPPTIVAKTLGISKQRLHYYLKKAYEMGLLEKKKAGIVTFYKLTPHGIDLLKNSKKSLVTYEDDKKTSHSHDFDRKFIKNVRIHHFTVKFPIEIDNERLKAGRENELKNWNERYFKIHGLKVTLKKTTKHIIAYFHEIKIPADSRFFANLTLYFARYFNALKEILWQRYRILIDIGKAQVISQHLANYIPVLTELADKTTTKQSRITVYLGRNAKTITGEIDQEAYAEIDYSKFRETGLPEWETNDLLYEEKLLLMPEFVFALDKKLTPAINWLAENIITHKQVLEDMKNTLRDIRNSLKDRPSSPASDQLAASHSGHHESSEDGLSSIDEDDFDETDDWRERCKHGLFHGNCPACSLERIEHDI